MSDTTWKECPNLQECTEGNRFGKGCVEDPVQSAMGGKPWHSCHCGVDSDGSPPNLRQADEITRLRAEVKQAQMREACAADLAREWEHHCKTAEAKVETLRAEVEKLRAVLGDIHAAAGNNHLIANIARAALEASDE